MSFRPRSRQCSPASPLQPRRHDPSVAFGSIGQSECVGLKNSGENPQIQWMIIIFPNWIVVILWIYPVFRHTHVFWVSIYPESSICAKQILLWSRISRRFPQILLRDWQKPCPWGPGSLLPYSMTFQLWCPWPCQDFRFLREVSPNFKFKSLSFKIQTSV